MSRLGNEKVNLIRDSHFREAWGGPYTADKSRIFYFITPKITSLRIDDLTVANNATLGQREEIEYMHRGRTDGGKMPNNENANLNSEDASPSATDYSTLLPDFKWNPLPTGTIFVCTYCKVNLTKENVNFHGTGQCHR